MKMVENWRSAAKWFSVQMMAVIAAIPVVWPMIPAELRAYVPEGWGIYIFTIVAIGGIAGRLIDQGTGSAP